jgi:hypothetical protein
MLFRLNIVACRDIRWLPAMQIACVDFNPGWRHILQMPDRFAGESPNILKAGCRQLGK